jgi:hypothetical protein
MKYFTHPPDRLITISNGQKINAVFREMFIGHIDNVSAAFGKSAKHMQIAIKVIATVEATKPGQVIALEDEHYAIVKDAFENSEKFNVALPVFTWRHVFDWIEAIINASDKPPSDNVTPITQSVKASKAGK